MAGLGSVRWLFANVDPDDLGYGCELEVSGSPESSSASALPARAGQRKLIEVLADTRELEPEVVAAVKLVVMDEELTEDQVLDLVKVLMSAREHEDSESHVGGIISR